jgi:hypothetical protein
MEAGLSNLRQALVQKQLLATIKMNTKQFRLTVEHSTDGNRYDECTS